MVSDKLEKPIKHRKIRRRKPSINARKMFMNPVTKAPRPMKMNKVF